MSTTSITAHCYDATEAEHLSRFSSAERMHQQCPRPDDCGCYCHEDDQ